jgi:Domain of unknown function (DUF4388)
VALQGTLDTFSLPDVLRLLATTSKTGRLRIEGDRGHGSVWLNEGGVVDADAERAVDGTPTDEVVFELLRFGSGSFAFDSDDRGPDGATSEGVDELLRRAGSLLSEWTELEAVVPSLEHQVTLAADLSADEVTIDADRWRSVVAVASGRTVGELASELGLSELGVSRVVRDLVDLGVADVEAPGAVPDAPRRADPPVRDRSRRPAAPSRPEGEVPAPVGHAEPVPEPTRAAWLSGDPTGETPLPSSDTRTTAPTASAATGQARGTSDGDSTRLAPADAPTNGGLSSRLGRTSAANQAAPSANGSPRTPGGPSVTPAARSNDRGRTPPPARTDDTGRTPRARSAEAGRTSPPARTDDTGRTPRARSADAGRTPPPARPAEAGRTPAAPRPIDRGRTPPPARPTDAGGRSPIAPGSPEAVRPPRRDVGGPRRSIPDGPPPGPAPLGPGAGAPGVPASPFDSGRLGPSPLPNDTGRIPPVTPSSLPPDLHWAADDLASPGPRSGQHPALPSSPFSGLSSLGPSRPAPAEGEVAAHLVAMSPEARAAVQATVGNTGGLTGGRGGGQGDDVVQRGRLISFLSSVR